MSPAHGATRLARAATLGTTCLLLALTAHVVAGGAAPSLLALVLLAVPLCCLSVLVTGSRVGPVRLGLVLTVTQVTLHEAFMVLARPGCAPVRMVAGMAGAGHTFARSGAASTPLMHCGGGATSGAMSMAAPSSTMVLLHLVAAVLTALLLWSGERMIWRLARWLRSRALRLTLGVQLPAGARLLPLVSRGAIARVVGRSGPLSRRGPPAGLAVTTP